MRVTDATVDANFATLVDVLRHRALAEPEQEAVAFATDDATAVTSVTYEELDRRARAVGGELRLRGLAGERALLIYPPGLEFVVAFFGCLYAGAIAVPAYPPTRRYVRRLAALAIDARPAVVLTTQRVLTEIEAIPEAAALLAGIDRVSTDIVADDRADEWTMPDTRPDDVAFLQYTSGSTARPKGVAVSHGNIIHNSGAIARCFGHTGASRGVIWLPHQHDMGLIGGVIQPVYLGARITLVSPLAFLQRPLSVLDLISRTRATTSGGPDFAYEMWASKATAQQVATLDLSSWEVAFTGAEPVRAGTLDRFYTTFAPAGFRREAFHPCYGLAEATLLVTGARVGEAPRTQVVRASALGEGRVEPADAGSTDSRTLVSMGRPWEQRVAVVDPESGRRLADGQVGEVWVSGASVALGYWNRPDESERVFNRERAGDDRRWLRTGDLGYLDDGELYFVGRLKDLIIVTGQNHYPEDIEEVVEASHPSLRPHGCAAFAAEDGDTERLVVVAEVRARPREEPGIDVAAVTASVRRAVAETHGIRAHQVVLVRRGTIPRTTSGKVQRDACRRSFLAGRLTPLGAGR